MDYGLRSTVYGLRLWIEHCQCGGMIRDHKQLRVFHDAHRLTLAIYQLTKDFPRDEWYGLRLQMRRAAVSVPTNLVEGNARRTTRDYCHFVNIALASASELAYLVTLSTDLHLIAAADADSVATSARSVVRQLQRLQQTMERLAGVAMVSSARP
jgi:four helix bundle protein